MLGLSAQTIANIEAGAKTAAGLDWKNLAAAIHSHDWAGAAEIAVEDALTIAQPFLPQASTARMVLHLAYSLAASAADAHKTTGAFTVKDLVKGLYAAEGVDWTGFIKALKGDNAIVAGADTAEALAKLAAPFFPPAAVAGGAFGILAMIGSGVHPANVDYARGWRFDALRGWVRLKPGEPQPGPANPFAYLATLLS